MTRAECAARLRAHGRPDIAARVDRCQSLYVQACHPATHFGGKMLEDSDCGTWFDLALDEGEGRIFAWSALLKVAPTSSVG